MFAATPIVYEQMAHYLKQTNDFAAVQKLKYAITGGAVLKKEMFEWFHGNNVNVRPMYGSTESNTIMACDLDRNSKNYESLRMFQRDAQGQPYGSFEINDENEPHIKHLYIHAGSPMLGSHVSNRADGGYSTQDLFIESTDFPGYYTYIGRRDDTLVMENGEKTNPLPMEATIRQSPMVEQVAVIGHGRQCTAALIQLNAELAKGISDEEIFKAVYDSVKEANNECPNHSKIFPQMVKILSLDQKLPTTTKGTIMRKKAEMAYQDVVEKLYKNFLERPKSRASSSNNIDVSAWTFEQIECFLIDSAAEVLDIPPSIVKDHPKSLFHLGLNSINAIQLRNRICEYFDDVASNFIYQHYSIQSMAKALMSNKREDIQEQITKQYQRTQTLAESYIKKAKRDFPRANSQYDESKPKVVLLTGATGSVGSFILRELLQDPTVDKIYCCVRGEDHQLRDRLVEALTSRLLDASMLETERVEVLPMRFDEPFLGFSKQRYHQLKKEVTIIQHCAWLLNFNMPIDHFDKECIQPFYNLLKFAFNETNPMYVYFVSSVSASALLGSIIAEEPLPLDPKCALPLGYSTSKFIVEVLMNYLTAEKNFPCYVQRLGQVCGDSVNGVWNTSEQYPLMFIGGGSIMGIMPRLNTEIDWIPCDFAAASIVDIMMRTSHLPANTNESIYHIVNSHSIPWYDVLTAMKKSGMEFDIVEPTEWVKELAKDDKNPAFRLMSFYQETFKDSFKMAKWKTEKTRALTPIISQSPVLNTDLFSRYLSYWKSVGFYDPFH
ncbi:L-aminoadipate-semialdehyde dehydrogenase [Mucor ambiguus]|uniref:L-aminoadipate-semialdehyde dehydrogenase n=1 Tax=Mucor ambiguus TaxID=91626 RepID=A0A0C9LUE0_9FUNG|nr:L-aminoadipate-semialdehyde dehydrogenase [Mucor ambiguus]